jgi:hypothetical protein
MDGFVKRTHPWTHYLPTGLDNLPAATAHNITQSSAPDDVHMVASGRACSRERRYTGEKKWQLVGTHPWTHYPPTGLDNLPAATAHNNTRL